MQPYILMTDSDSDLPLTLKEQYDIPVVYMPYTLDGKEYFDDLGQTLDSKSFYDKMRAGAMPTTSALNQTVYEEYFEPILADGKDLLFLAFSSQLSMTINAIRAAREELLQKYPERKFIVVDTLSISAPQTLLVLKAHEMYREGADIETVAQWVEDNKLRAQAFFTVNDLTYLKRGGRISPAVAAVGTLLDLKPILIETREGKLDSTAKVRGRKKAMNFIVEKSVENIVDPRESIAILLHADCREDAEKLAAQVQAKLPDLTIRIENIGPVIGAHVGPGALAFCFIGKERAQ
ncbi:MAG: DegV family protein [Clostridia bacterium]|nr:DegV family protein [Clostridia bacterium]